MYYCKSRYYKPQINRWINMDDISYLDKKTINGFNLYAYCNNNPVNMSDLNGNSALGFIISCLLSFASSQIIALVDREKYLDENLYETIEEAAIAWG